MKLLIAFLLSLPILAIAQDRKTIKQRSTYFIEEMDVLANDKTIRDGTYQKRFRDNDKLLEQGQYAANKRVGVWTFYATNGEPELIYDYTQKAIIKRRPQKTASVMQRMEGDSLVSIQLDEGPTYLASSYQIGSVMFRNVKFLDNLQRPGIKHLEFNILATVSPQGATYRIISSNSDNKRSMMASKQAATAAFEGVEWVPAVYERNPVTATYLVEKIIVTNNITNTR